jgi:hypothetical protein
MSLHGLRFVSGVRLFGVAEFTFARVWLFGVEFIVYK